MPHRESESDLEWTGGTGQYEDELAQYSPDDYPFYTPGEPPDFHRYGEVSWLDELGTYWDKEWGNQGIGELKEVVVTKPMPNEVHPMWTDDADYFMSPDELPPLETIRENHAALVEVLEDEGLTVHWMEYEFPPEGPYGLLKRTMSGAVAFVVNGGAILPREATPWLRGRARHLQEFFTDIGCPILHTIHGDGILEIGGSRWIAEDAWLGFVSSDGNTEAIEQVEPVMRRAGVEETVIARSPGPHREFRWNHAQAMHPDMWFAPLDIGLALIYPDLCDYGTLRWFKDHGFELVEVPEGEQREYYPANLIPLEPGKVIMNGKAGETIRRVRERGIEVIEVDFSSAQTYGGGLSCVTGFLVREEGPGLDELAEGPSY